jgi:hypothetical protein
MSPMENNRKLVMIECYSNENRTENILVKSYIRINDSSLYTIYIPHSYFNQSFDLYLKLKKYENIDDFCENEAFGLLFSIDRNSSKNIKLYANKLKEYILNKTRFHLQLN